MATEELLPIEAKYVEKVIKSCRKLGIDPKPAIEKLKEIFNTSFHIGKTPRVIAALAISLAYDWPFKKDIAEACGCTYERLRQVRKMWQELGGKS